jgi:phosphoglycolate phosphatase-like HAD superfamily hydrolase
MKTIVWDLDDVLNNLMQSWLSGTRHRVQSTYLVPYEKLTENPPDRILGMTRNEYLSSLDSFRISDEARSMVPAQNLVHWFNRYGHIARHMVLTGRPVDTMPMAADWVYRHFGRWIRTVSYVPSRQEEQIGGHDRSKKEFLEWLAHADILIDDSPENIHGARSIGITAVMMPQPWNDAPPGLEHMLHTLTGILQEK